MILVDTSVIIGYLKGKPGAPYSHLDAIVEHKVPFGICNYVYQELLQGTKTEKEFRELKEYLDDLTFYDLRNGRKSYEDCALLYAKCRRAGVTVRSTIDVIIAQIAIENDLHLLHDDNDYINIANVIKDLKLISWQ